MKSTAQEKRRNFQDKFRNDAQAQSLACVFLTTNVNCLILQNFSENLVGMAEHLVDNNVIDTGWMGVSAFCCVAMVGWTAVSSAISWKIGQNLTDMNYREKAMNLEISLIGEHLNHRPR